MNLRSDMRQNVQLTLDFRSTPTGEARKAPTEAVESRQAAHAIESPASTNRLMEEVCDRENLREALRR
jgi:RNA-directed DNA polymerase